MRESPTFATAVVKWAQDVADKPAGNETQEWMREEAIISDALIAVRDGSGDLIAAHADWIRGTFRRAFKGKHDPVHRTREGLQYNPIAIAFVGTALLLKNRFEMADVRTLLEVAGDNPAAAQGFYYVAGVLAAIDERLPRAVLRCAFSACVKPSRQWDTPEEDHKAQMDARQRQVAAAIEAEFAWLNGRQVEPGCPTFEPTHAHSRHRYSFKERRRQRDDQEVRPEQYTDHQAAALWLGKAASIFDVTKRPWLRDLAKMYSKWTMVANGAELEEDDDPDRIPHEWNYAYFNLLAHCLPRAAPHPWPGV